MDEENDEVKPKKSKTSMDEENDEVKPKKSK